jgi:ribosomal protein S1
VDHVVRLRVDGELIRIEAVQEAANFEREDHTLRGELCDGKVLDTTKSGVECRVLKVDLFIPKTWYYTVHLPEDSVRFCLSSV